jgi:protein TonB
MVVFRLFQTLCVTFKTNNMTVIISVIIFVAVISLYEYFSERSWQRVSSTIRNEVVFEKRNKKYGAYALRKNYDKTIVFILIGMVVSFGATFAAYNLSKGDTKSDVKVPKSEEVTIVLDSPPVDKDLPPVAPGPTKPTIAAMIQNLPMIVVDEIVDVTVPTQEQMQETTVGAENQQGGTDVFLPEIGGEPPIETIEPINEEPIVYVEEEAEYLGGYARMMKFIQEHLVYPSTEIEIGTQGRVTLRFVVEKNGEISNVSILQSLSPDCDKAAIKVVRDMPNWKPGKNGGRAVRQWCTLPINFTLN